MEQKLQLKHPAGKKAIRMDKDKYELLSKYLLANLESNGNSTHTELLNSITDGLKKDKIKFMGSVEWHVEWVKLDLEANKKIKRIGDKSPIKYALT